MKKKKDKIGIQISIQIRLTPKTSKEIISTLAQDLNGRLDIWGFAICILLCGSSLQVESVVY